MPHQWRNRPTRGCDLQGGSHPGRTDAVLPHPGRSHCLHVRQSPPETGTRRARHRCDRSFPAGCRTRRSDGPACPDCPARTMCLGETRRRRPRTPRRTIAHPGGALSARSHLALPPRAPRVQARVCPRPLPCGWPRAVCRCATAQSRRRPTRVSPLPPHRQPLSTTYPAPTGAPPGAVSLIQGSCVGSRPWTTEFTWSCAHRHSPGCSWVVSRSSETILQAPDGRIHVRMGQIFPRASSPPHLPRAYNPFSTSRMSSFVGRTL